jgi:hypothetical protein
MTKDQPCAEKARLAEVLEKAVEATVLVNANLLAAYKEKREATFLAVQLIRVRSAEFAAPTDLERHRIKHGF